MTDEQLEARFNGLEQLVQAVTNQIDWLRRDINALQRQATFLAEMVATLQQQLADFHKHHQALGAELSDVRSSQLGQWHGIERLNERVNRLEQRTNQPPQ